MNQSTLTSTGTLVLGGGQRRWIALTVLLIPAALTLLSVTSVNVALPTIREGLQADTVTQSLVLTAYALAFAIVLLPAGRWGDRYGHKSAFIAGVIIFTAASAWCGLAADSLQIVAARILAGVGAGFALTPVNALIQLLYRGPERARPFGIMGAVYGAASAVGPLLGGLLIQAGGDLGWRLVFLVNVPIGVLAVVLAIFVLPSPQPRGSAGSDPIGMLLFTAAIVGTMLPFSLGDGFHTATVVMLIVGVLLFVAFVLWERRRDRRGSFAVVPLRLFRQRALVVGVLSSLFGFAGFTSVFLMLALLWQDALGHSALAAGLLVAPFALGTVVGAMHTRALTQRFGSRVVTAGLTLVTVGIVVTAVLLMVVPRESLTIWVLLVPLVTTGYGVGLFVGPNTNASFVQTEGRDAGVASALVTAAQRCGTAIGIGLLSALYATMPGGPGQMSTQIVAALVTAAFSAAGVAVMVISRRSKLVV